MAVTVAQFETHLDAARGYAASGDLASALPALDAAIVCRIALPDAGDASAQVSYPSVADLRSLRSQWQAQVNATAGVARTGGPIQRSKITWKRATT